MTGGLVGGLEEAKAHIRWTPMEQRARRASSTGGFHCIASSDRMLVYPERAAHLVDVDCAVAVEVEL